MSIAIDCRDGFSGEPLPCTWNNGTLTLHSPHFPRPMVRTDVPTIEDAKMMLRSIGYRVEDEPCQPKP